MARKVQPEDEAAIVALANKYTDAVNNRDWERYRACWTDDAVWDLGSPVNQRKEGIEAIMTEVQRAVGAMDLFVQMNHAPTVLAVDGDTALARATLNEIGHVKPEHRDLLGGAEGMFILAIYTDEVRRTRDGWRYAKRTYKVPYFDPTPLRGLIDP
jgi:ketosteroid isomerase-like protein